MGQHSSGNRWPYIRSMIGWFLPWVLIAGVVAMAVWVAVDVVGKDDGAQTATQLETPVEAEEPTPEEIESEEPEPEPVETLEEIVETPEPELITEGVTLQVLNGTPDDTVDERVADELAQMGFEVVAVQDSSRTYSETTVFYSNPESEEAAIALAEQEGWVVEPKPENLSSEVDLHVVIGVDEL
jgi:hypothetical protein